MKEAQAQPWHIRAERPEDAPLVEALNEATFGPGRYAKSAYRLREGVAAEPGLSFIAVEEATLRGSVRFWPVRIGQDSALLLGAAFLGEQVTLPAVMGMALIGLGLAAIDGRPWTFLVKMLRGP